ncbi:MAG: hypothetical protein EAZ27_05225 [Cytophagales bacterium]|nr:MAG: hypothetical protein EAZ27_05225 [Cytophagales bacterium]
MKIHRKTKTLNLFLVLLSLVIANFSSCSKKEKVDDFSELSKSDSSGKINNATSELASQVIKSIPPPVEMESMILSSGAPYDLTILNGVAEAEKYSTNYHKAINLGIYGADLAYINIYNRKEDALSYLNTVIKLSEDLKVGQFFDFETIKRIADNNKNLDSMLNITTSNFEKMNNYLQDQNRSNLSMYMLTGGWVEALYVACKVGLDKKNQPLYEKIAEQKIVLDQILLLLSCYKNDPNAMTLHNDLNELKETFNKIKIETVYAEPTMVEENGQLVVKDNSKTIIVAPEDVIMEIFTSITNTRKKIIG